MSKRDFYREVLTRMFTEKAAVLDIGGGLRLAGERGNRRRGGQEWLEALAKKVDYKIMDPVPTFNPDIVGDIHKMPFPDNSLDAIVCAAVLEHVENPIKAVEEMHRALKPGGFCYVFVPFLFYYHAEPGYYKDYWRFSEDALHLLFKDFSSMEIAPSRGALETWFHLNPATQRLQWLARFLDRIIGKQAHQTKQVNGYSVFLIK